MPYIVLLYPFPDYYCLRQSPPLTMDPSQARSKCVFGGSPLIFELWNMQNVNETSLPLFVTLNPPHLPKSVLLKWSRAHLVPSVAATKASLEFDILQGKRGIWFSLAYHGKIKQESLTTFSWIICTFFVDSSRTICIQR